MHAGITAEHRDHCRAQESLQNTGITAEHRDHCRTQGSLQSTAGPAEASWVWYGKMGYVHYRRQCVEARSADMYIARSAEIFFTVIFLLPGWGLVAPSCFALHCHCCLVSVQSVTVSLSTWKGNVRCARSPRLLIIRRRVFRCCYSTSWLHPFLNRTW